MYNFVDHGRILDVVLPFIVYCMKITDELVSKRDEPRVARVLEKIAREYNQILYIFYKRNYFINRYNRPVIDNFLSTTSSSSSSSSHCLNPREISALSTLIEKKQIKLVKLISRENVL